MFVTEGGYGFKSVEKVVATTTISSIDLNNSSLLLTNLGDSTVYISNEDFTDIELGFPLKAKESIQSVRFSKMFFKTDIDVSTLQIIKLEVL